MVRIFHCILSSLCSIFTPSTRPTKGAHAVHAERQGSVSRPRLAARPKRLGPAVARRCAACGAARAGVCVVRTRNASDRHTVRESFG